MNIEVKYGVFVVEAVVWDSINLQEGVGYINNYSGIVEGTISGYGIADSFEIEFSDAITDGVLLDKKGLERTAEYFAEKVTDAKYKEFEDPLAEKPWRKLSDEKTEEAEIYCEDIETEAFEALSRDLTHDGVISFSSIDIELDDNVDVKY